MLKRVVIGVSFMSLVLVGQVFAENQGAKIIYLKGGGFGRVLFTHQHHQNKLADCQVCHGLFAMETGAIDKGVSAGTLTRVQVMDQCRNCHSETAMAGKKSGSTACKGCHAKR